MDELLQIAIRELGVKEIEGPEHNPVILKYAKEVGFKNVQDDETFWCSIFMNWVAKKAKLPRSNKLNARSWLLVGETIDHPKPGDVVIFWRERIDSWKGHVAIFIGFNESGTLVYCLGGNQDNMVSIRSYEANRILGFRRLNPEDLHNLPETELKFGDKGEDVKHLQMALNKAGFDCGLADGDFGPKTRAAVEQLQTTDINLTITGVFDAKTRELLKERLA
ncbi:TIGR02594 family protein [Roseivirga sp. BDSF3-8]|uniref:C40 family peptidase n=1 Tax=Roseivirga sp. BDSF3-8 TaxID=3241598 RepID=UPI0035324472